VTSTKSYSTILKSSSIIGGSEVIKLLIGIVQVKFVAVFLGPTGVGLVGLYSTLIGLFSRAFGLGLNASGVREVAKAVGKEDQEKVGRTVYALRRVCWVTGIVGSSALALCAQPLSIFSFGSSDHAWALALLAWIILLYNIQSAQMAYLQGLRRIGDLARLKIIGELGGAVIGIGFYVWLRMDGIVPALLSIAVFNLGTSCWYALKVPAPKAQMSWREVFHESKGMVRMGIVFMWSGLLTVAVAYLTRVLINLDLGLDAVGIFQSSFRISVMFVGFVLMAMGTDFLPRLSSIAENNSEVSRLVNEQTEIGLLLAVPGIVAILLFSPWVIKIFYTSEFAESAVLLQWFVLGCMGRVISWPMRYVILAKGKGRLMIFSESAAHLLHLLLIWIGLQYFGVVGVAIAFFAFCIAYVTYMRCIVGHLCGFTWSPGVNRLCIKIVPFIAAVFLLSQYLLEIYAIPLGLLCTFLACIYCLKELTGRLENDHKITRIFSRFPFIKNHI
jgi:O-antigen/teichoic acid export membrane protein